eukprot:TRINITY_DN56927_c0_g1_i2.p1 TRINITY_DN56927_c0_g1~~TRINITY_DN56927_c0_g1_i2.p1  ORF type:complete len:891 (+),score=4.99 TRINITY_DN56927_c0_g1_i2:98-2674(+)
MAALLTFMAAVFLGTICWFSGQTMLVGFNGRGHFPTAILQALLPLVGLYCFVAFAVVAVDHYPETFACAGIFCGQKDSPFMILPDSNLANHVANSHTAPGWFYFNTIHVFWMCFFFAIVQIYVWVMSLMRLRPERVQHDILDPDDNEEAMALMASGVVERGYSHNGMSEDINLHKVFGHQRKRRAMRLVSILVFFNLFLVFWWITTLILPAEYEYFAPEMLWHYQRQKPSPLARCNTEKTLATQKGMCPENQHGLRTITVYPIHWNMTKDGKAIYTPETGYPSTVTVPYGTEPFFHTHAAKAGPIYLKFFPDTAIVYWGLVAGITLAALLCTPLATRRLMYARLPYVPFGVNLGRFFLVLTLTVILTLFFIYWYHDHAYRSAGITAPIGIPYEVPGPGFVIDLKTAYSVRWKQLVTWEAAVRTIGQMANLVFGLLLYPASRQSILIYAFDVSWEALIQLHRLLGYFALFLSSLHVALWYGYWYLLGKDRWWEKFAPHDFFPWNVPQYYQSNGADFMPPKPGEDPPPPRGYNWTVPLMTWLFYPMLVSMLVFAFYKIRRSHFELFYYTHHLGIIIYLGLLWHAASSWYWLVTGLIMWFFDRILRLIRGAAKVTTVAVQAHGDVTELVVKCDSMRPFRAGQYSFINIPSISGWQWHPMTISSSPTDHHVSFHIKDMGPMQWSWQLNAMARDPASNLKNLVVRLDGPYGNPPDPHDYPWIVFVAGGIGITPCHSMFRCLLHEATQGFNDGAPFHVKLVWIAQTPALFENFALTLREVFDKSASDRFQASLYVTREETFSDGARGENSFPYQTGRPSMGAELTPVDFTEGGLVFVCGPESLQEDCRRCCPPKTHFHAETFEL